MGGGRRFSREGLNGSAAGGMMRPNASGGPTAPTMRAADPYAGTGGPQVPNLVPAVGAAGGSGPAAPVTNMQRPTPRQVGGTLSERMKAGQGAWNARPRPGAAGSSLPTTTMRPVSPTNPVQIAPAGLTTPRSPVQPGFNPGASPTHAGFQGGASPAYAARQNDQSAQDFLRGDAAAYQGALSGQVKAFGDMAGQDFEKKVGDMLGGLAGIGALRSGAAVSGTRDMMTEFGRQVGNYASMTATDGLRLAQGERDSARAASQRDHEFGANMRQRGSEFDRQLGFDESRYARDLAQRGSEFDRNLGFDESRFGRELTQRGHEFDSNLGQRESEFGRDFGQRQSEYDRNLQQRQNEFRDTYGLDRDRFNAEQEDLDIERQFRDRQYNDARKASNYGAVGSALGGFFGAGGMGGRFGGGGMTGGFAGGPGAGGMVGPAGAADGAEQQDPRAALGAYAEAMGIDPEQLAQQVMSGKVSMPGGLGALGGAFGGVGAMAGRLPGAGMAQQVGRALGNKLAAGAGNLGMKVNLGGINPAMQYWQAGDQLKGALGRNNDLGRIGSAAAKGAAIGSVVPVIGTGVGAAIGAGAAALSRPAKKVGGWLKKRFSDARLKHDIERIDTVGEVGLYSFKWADGRPDTGFIAQEVQRVLPSAVERDPASGFLRVDYDMVYEAALRAA
jgi:hypothetical protein